MPKIRTIPDLFKIMLENTRFFNSGMCAWICSLCECDIINLAEYRILKRFISEMGPEPITPQQSYYDHSSIYYWPSGDIQPRLRWINYHLNNFYNQHINSPEWAGDKTT